MQTQPTSLTIHSGLQLADVERLSRELRRIGDEIPLADTIEGVLVLRDQAEAIRSLAKIRGGHLEIQNQAAENRLRCDRRAGEMLAGMPKNEGTRLGGNIVLPPDAGTPTLDDMGITPMQSSRWQAVAAISEVAFEAYVREPKDEEITTAGLLRKVHVSHNSGENEWYTPSEYIEAARRVLGGIDLDPASTEQANTVVKAARFYTIEDDGLAQQWTGRVWMNPPYAADKVGLFTAKAVQHFHDGDIAAAVVLVNNATETQWFQGLAKPAAAICFPERRVRFWNPQGAPGAPLQGQAVIYLGTDIPAFKAVFAPFGLLVRHG